MKVILIYVLSFLPFFVYNFICFLSNKKTTGIDLNQVIISGALAFLGYLIAQKSINKSKNK